MKEQRETIIRHYIEAYNNYDVEGMIRHMSAGIKFENISNGQVNMTIEGIEEFKKQAEQAKAFFSGRKQTIQSFDHDDNSTTIEIDYSAILAMDFPNGMKKGDALTLAGSSVFTFDENKIIALKDIS